MALSDLFTQAQLERVCGGAYRLVELAQASSSVDQAYLDFIAQVRLAAQADVYGLMQVAFDPTDPTVSTSPVAQAHCLSIARYWAWSYGTGGQAIPEDVSRDRTMALEGLTTIRDGQAALGTDTEPTSNAGAKTVTLDSTGTRILRANMRGFC